MLSRIFVLAAGVVSAAVMSAPALAQPDFQHHQAMIDIAATPPWDYGDDFGDDHDDGSGYDLGDWQDWRAASPIQLTGAEIETIAKYRAYMDGKWFHDGLDAGETDGACVSTFLRQGSGAMVIALGEWALLGFFSPDAPRPAELQTLQVTLKQDADPPATVNAFNMALPWDRDRSGLIVFAVPAVGALIGGMGETQSFAVSVGGKPAVNIGWSDGHAARDELLACIEAR